MTTADGSASPPPETDLFGVPLRAARGPVFRPLQSSEAVKPTPYQPPKTQSGAWTFMIGTSLTTLGLLGCLASDVVDPVWQGLMRAAASLLVVAGVVACAVSGRSATG